MARHATDRGAFDSLIAGLSHEAAASVDLTHRRAAYRASAHLWGMQLGARVQVGIYVPDETNGPDSVSVAGWVELSASRPTAGLTVPVSNYMRSIDPAAEGRAPRIEASERQSRAIELLAPLSSPGLPRFERVLQPDGRELGNLRLQGVGQGPAVTFFMQARAAHACDDPVPGVGTLLRVPSRTLHSDLLVTEGQSDPASAERAVYGRPDSSTGGRNAGPRIACRPAWRFRVRPASRTCRGWPKRRSTRRWCGTCWSEWAGRGGGSICIGLELSIRCCTGRWS